MMVEWLRSVLWHHKKPDPIATVDEYVQETMRISGPIPPVTAHDTIMNNRDLHRALEQQARDKTLDHPTDK